MTNEVLLCLQLTMRIPHAYVTWSHADRRTDGSWHLGICSSVDRPTDGQTALVFCSSVHLFSWRIVMYIGRASRPSGHSFAVFNLSRHLVNQPELLLATPVPPDRDLTSSPRKPTFAPWLPSEASGRNTLPRLSNALRSLLISGSWEWSIIYPDWFLDR